MRPIGSGSESEDARRDVWLPLSVGLAPPLVAHACHGISAAAGIMPWCLPYLEGCLSISAASRHPPANFLFDGLMIPLAVLLMVFWSRTRNWLENPGIAASAIAALGVAAGCFMVVNSVFLGAEQDYARLLRRIGINGYVLCNFLAQTGLTWLLFKHHRDHRLRLLVFCGSAVLLLGVMSAVEDLADWRNNQIDNIIEWNAALFMSAYFLVIAWLWSRPPGPPDRATDQIHR